MVAGPAAYFTGLPAKAIVARLQQAGLPGAVAGFIRLPPLPEQAARHPPSIPMALADQVRALRLVVDTVVTGIAELHTPAGRMA